MTESNTPAVPLPEPMAWLNKDDAHKFRWMRERFQGGGATDLSTARYMQSDYHSMPLFTADQMRDYAAARVAAERERCALEAERWQKISTTPGHACGQYIAAAIRGA